MENFLIGLGKKQKKAGKLHHDLLINIFKEDCTNFDLFLAGYCLLSIAYKIVWYSLEYDNLKFIDALEADIETIVLDCLGLIAWLFGFIVSVRSLLAYSLMKYKTIKKSAKRLLWYMGFQTLYFGICLGLITRDVYLGNENIYKSGLTSSNKLLLFSFLVLIFISNIIACLYFYSQKLGLAEEIQQFDTISNKGNAVYVKSTSILDV